MRQYLQIFLHFFLLLQLNFSLTIDLWLCRRLSRKWKWWNTRMRLTSTSSRVSLGARSAICHVPECLQVLFGQKFLCCEMQGRSGINPYSSYRDDIALHPVIGNIWLICRDYRHFLIYFSMYPMLIQFELLLQSSPLAFRWNYFPEAWTVQECNMNISWIQIFCPIL